jgi:hypothetical protein
MQMINAAQKTFRITSTIGKAAEDDLLQWLAGVASGVSLIAVAGALWVYAIGYWAISFLALILLALIGLFLFSKER